MDVTPKTVREVEFREKMRGGYHPEDVDQFLEQVAVGLEVLHDRLRQAVERAQRAESAANDAGGTDDTLRKTLVLAQRTADLAVQEAREQAARIVAAAEQRAQAMLGEAEDLARRVHDEALGDIRNQLTRLEAQREQSQQEVEALSRWLTDHRGNLVSALKDALAIVERIGPLQPPPSTRPIDLPWASASSAASASGSVPVPAAPSSAILAPPPAEPAPPAATESSLGEASPSESPALPLPPEPQAGAPEPPGATPEEPTAMYAPPRRLAAPEGEAPVTGEYSSIDGPDQQALDDFFEDPEVADDRRFGGRLRRRR